MRFLKKVVIGILIFVIFILEVFGKRNVVMGYVSPLMTLGSNSEYVVDDSTELEEGQTQEDKVQELMKNDLKTKYGCPDSKLDEIVGGEAVIKWKTTITVVSTNDEEETATILIDGASTELTMDKMEVRNQYGWEGDDLTTLTTGTTWEVGFTVEFYYNRSPDGIYSGTMSLAAYTGEDLTDEFEAVEEEEGRTQDERDEAMGITTDEHYDDEDDSDIGGILLEPIVWLINILADGAQSLVTAFMRDDIGWIAILQGKRFATMTNSTSGKMAVLGNLNGNNKSNHIVWYIDENENGSFDSEIDKILLELKGSNNSEDLGGWHANTEMNAEGSQAYYRTEGLVSGSDVDDYDGSLGGNEYYINTAGYKNRYSFPLIAYSPEEIFAGDVEILNANFIGSDSDSSSTFVIIRNVVRGWFSALRYLGLAGLLAVLIYTGIKIMTSSASQDKAKYKERIVDWIMAMVIMFLLPYIMSFIFTVSDKLIDLFNNDASQQPITVYVYDPNAGNGDWTALSNLPLLGGVFDFLADRVTDITGVSVQGHKYTYTKFTTNLMGLVRFQVQSRNVTKLISYEIMYIMLIVFTIRFTIMYLKRMLYIAFLTMISPIVAMMYPIDKIGDGKSQSFEMWLKEYIFNALLQPLHMLIYYVFISSAMNFATENIIYVLVVFGFMTQAEKILKEIFGFGKASMGTVGGLSGATQTALTLSGITGAAKNIKQLIGSSNNTTLTKNDGSTDDNGEIDSGDRVNFANYSNLQDSTEKDNQTDDNRKSDGNEASEATDREILHNTPGTDIHDYLDNSETGENYDETTDTQRMASSFSNSENQRLAELVDQGMNVDDAVEQIVAERQKNNGETPTQLNQQTGTPTIGNTPMPNNGLPQSNRFTAQTGARYAMKAMAARRAQNIRHAVSHITPKKVIKGLLS